MLEQIDDMEEVLLTHPFKTRLIAVARKLKQTGSMPGSLAPLLRRDRVAQLSEQDRLLLNEELDLHDLLQK